MKADPASGRVNHADSALESAARLTIEQRLGRALDDEEWKRARQRLIEFVMTLQRWDRRKGCQMPSREDKPPCKEIKEPAA